MLKSTIPFPECSKTPQTPKAPVRDAVACLVGLNNLLDDRKQPFVKLRTYEVRSINANADATAAEWYSAKERCFYLATMTRRQPISPCSDGVSSTTS